MASWRIIEGDCRDALALLDAGSVPDVRIEMHAAGRARATDEREAVPDSLANQREE